MIILLVTQLWGSLALVLQWGTILCITASGVPAMEGGRIKMNIASKLACLKDGVHSFPLAL